MRGVKSVRRFAVGLIVACLLLVSDLLISVACWFLLRAGEAGEAKRSGPTERR